MDDPIWTSGKVPTLNVVRVEPEDLLGAVRTLTQKCRIAALNDLFHWLEGSTYLKWAAEDLAEGSERGRSNAVGNAKRAVCRRIDEMLLSNHLERFLCENYPKKLDALREVGESTPSVIHELVIDPRNDAEHAYVSVSNQTARRAVEVAGLFIAASNAGLGAAGTRPTGCVYGDSFQCTSHSSEGKSTFAFHVPPERPFLFVDVFATERTAFIVDVLAKQARACALKTFPPSEALAFSKWCRAGGPAFVGNGRAFFDAFRRAVGIP